MIAVLLIGVTALFAQDKTASDYRAEGKTAYKAKDYKTAFELFKKSIEVNETNGVTDTSLFYNAAYCAYKSKKYTDANVYFNKSIEIGYKKEKSYIFIANGAKRAKDNETLDKALEQGLKEFPESKKLLTFQAKRFFIVGLGHYNNASQLIQVAAQVVESDPKKFEIKKAEAEAEYKAAIPYLKKAYIINPTMKNLPEALIGAYESLGMKKEAEAMKKEQAEIQKKD